MMRAARTSSDTESGSQLRRSPVRRWLVATWLALVVLGAAAGTYAHFSYRADQMERSQADAQIVAEIAADNVAAWTGQRVSDARVMAENTGYTIRVRDYFDNPDDEVNTAAVVSRLTGEHQYRGFSYLQIFDSTGTFRLGVPATRTDDPADRAAVMAAFVSPPGSVEIGDVRVAPGGGVEVPITAALSVPTAGGREVPAVCVFHADLTTYVFPMLERWPGVTRTGEVLLVRPNETGYDILSPRRFDRGDAETIRGVLYDTGADGLSLSDFATDGPQVVGDYRDTTVYTVFEPVPGTPWVVQAKIDQDEVLAPVASQRVYAIAFVVLWVCAVTLGVGLIWRSRTFELELSQTRIEYAEAEAESLAELNRELEEAGAVKDTFLASMSHELRTPLNSIIGFSGVLAKGLAGPMNDEQQAQIEMISMSGRHLLSLIEDVLDLSKIEAHRVELAIGPCDLEAIGREAIATVGPLAEEKGLKLRTNLAVGDTLFHSDSGKVRQILLNLLGNAVKFTGSGSVSLVMRRQEGGGAVIEVEDTGPGIPPEDLGRVFDAFVQLRTEDAGKPKGTGLGLKLSREFANMLQGDITVRSTLGEGSTFTLWLPDLST